MTKIRAHLQDKSGLTLIEILIVITLIAIIGSLFTFKGGSTSLLADIEANRMAGFLRQCYNSAVIGNKVVRVKIDTTKNEVTYESANPGTLMPEPVIEKSIGGTDAPTDDGGGEFSEDTDSMSKKYKIKKEVKVDHIFVDGKEISNPFIYCFPQGFIQKSKIYLSDNTKAKRTVEVSSLTGKAEVRRGWDNEK